MEKFKNILGLIDFSEMQKKQRSVDYKQTGLELLDDVIGEIIQKYSNQYFFEYSLITSTINPKTRKLLAFSGVRSSDNRFKRNVEQCVAPIINKLYPTMGMDVPREERILALSKNWYHNPELFLFPTIDKIYPYYLPGKTDEENIDFKLEEKNNNLTYERIGQSDLYFSNMSYERQLDEILEASRKIILAANRNRIENTNNKLSLADELIEQYHNGAKTLKSCYDRYLPVAEIGECGDDYGYITFPIVSTKNHDIGKYYKVYMGNDLEVDKHVAGIGHFFLYFKRKTRSMVLDNSVIENLFIRINLILSHIALNYVYGTGVALSETARRDAVRAAKAAIMSRNMSHNLGSHVMFYIKQKLESVEMIFQTGALKDLMESRSIEDLNRKIDNNEIRRLEDGNKELPFLVGLGRFMNYLQERQDFIATVATNYIPYSTTINFKDAVYDELKPDKRVERHKGLESKGRKPKNLLLNYIAYSEGFKSSDSIELLFKKEDGTWFDGSGNPEDVPEKLREFNVSFPGGNLGRQAFFSIMENIIRNTAKHDKNKAENGKLKFRFERLLFDEINNIAGYSLRHGEDKNSSHILAFTDCYEQSQNDLYYLGITVAIGGDAVETIDKIKKGLRRDYLTPDGQMDDECKGLKEIRISAAWLRGNELDDEIPINEPPAVAIRITKEGYMQYLICLPKPKKVAFVISEYDKVDCSNIPKFLDKFGCQVFQIGDYKNGRCKMADFDLIICSNYGYDSVRRVVGSRILKTDICTKINEYNYVKKEYEAWYNTLVEYEQRKRECDSTSEEYNSVISQYEEHRQKDPVEAYIGKLYMDWLSQEFPEYDNAKLSICDEKSEKNNPETSRWIVDKIIHCGRSSASEPEYYNNTILYSTHYPGQASVIEESRKRGLMDTNSGLFPKARFVEAISGGNSTDRLIRHDKRDSAWYCRHMAAGLSQVAIFDERLCDLIVPEDKMNIKDKVRLYLKEHPSCTALEFAFGIELQGNAKLKDEQKRIVCNYLTDRPITVDNCVDSLKFLSADYSKTWQYREKGIWTFDIQIRKTEDQREYDVVDIVGYSAVPTRSVIGSYEAEAYDRETIAHIEREYNRIIVKPTNGLSIDDFEFKKFDFISIHQGLIEKVCDALKIDGKGSDLGKDSVTKAIFDAFSIKTWPFYSNVDNNGFLPQFIIHSGRSKPNMSDMPQHLPFLQFSAIDHAVRDCKHTLTELLYSAHYEQ